AMDVRFAPASDFGLSELAGIWREAYEGYGVELGFDKSQLRTHIRWSGIDLALSSVGLLEEEPFGLALVAREADEAWIGGFGIASPLRRRGLATRLIRVQ